MSSRYDHRRRDDRGTRYADRDVPRRGGRSRSRSPRRGAGDRDRDRRPSDHRDYRDDRRDRDRDYHRDDRRRDDRDRRDHHRDDRKDPRDHDRDRREPPRRDERDRDPGQRPSDRKDNVPRPTDKRPDGPDSVHSGSHPPAGSEEPQSRQTSEMPTEDHEEGETMDQDPQQDEEAAMMAMMGLPVQGFGTTKGKHVEGNQDGGANVKKMRTWRQYMNRRGGFNRPLDKIK